MGFDCGRSVVDVESPRVLYELVPLEALPRSR
jgi:hypothetical protein